MLAREGLSYADIEAVSFNPLSDMTKALAAEKRVDAVVIWGALTAKIRSACSATM